MGRGSNGIAVRRLGMISEAGAFGGLSDARLLERFAAGGGEAAELAFAALVERHGAGVLRACRALLRDEHQAHDAFQATFLVLARRARSGRARWRESVGPWLREAAYRVASTARAAEARRRRHERAYAGMAAPRLVVGPSTGEPDLPDLIREELDRLPDRDRAVVRLCDLEGCTQDEAARSLGWPVGTVKSRLSRGRARLRSRLESRGLVPAAIAAGLAGMARTAGAAVPARLAEATARAAFRVASGCPIADAAGASVVLFLRGAEVAMMTTQAGKAAILVVGVLMSGAAALAFGGGPGDDPTAEASAAAQAPTIQSGREALKTPTVIEFDGPGRLVQHEGGRMVFSGSNVVVKGKDGEIRADRIALSRDGEASDTPAAEFEGQERSQELDDLSRALGLHEAVDREMQKVELELLAGEVDDLRSLVRSALERKLDAEREDSDRASEARSAYEAARRAYLDRARRLSRERLRLDAAGGQGRPAKAPASGETSYRVLPNEDRYKHELPVRFKPTGSIAIEEVLRKSTRVAEAREQIVSQTEAAKAELQSMMADYTPESKLREAILPESGAHAETQDRLHALRNKIEAERERYQKEFAEREARTLADINREIRDVVADVAKERGFDSVVRISSGLGESDHLGSAAASLKDSVLYANPEYDITEQVIEELNRRYREAKPERGQR